MVTKGRYYVSYTTETWHEEGYYNSIQEVKYRIDGTRKGDGYQAFVRDCQKDIFIYEKYFGEYRPKVDLAWGTIGDLRTKTDFAY
jgi:hypothetical protein